MSELKPCPYCGKSPVIFHSTYDSGLKEDAINTIKSLEDEIERLKLEVEKLIVHSDWLSDCATKASDRALAFRDEVEKLKRMNKRLKTEE